jgi:hypothetical protein
MAGCTFLFYFLHEKNQYGCGLCFMVFNTTFNSFIGGGTGVPGENYPLVASHSQTLSHNVISSTPCHEQGLNPQF